MPQVAARITPDHEKWLKDYFRTKSAGAEFILPWAVDTFFRALNGIKSLFSEPELKTIVEAHKDIKLLPDQSRLAYLQLRLQDACDLDLIHTRYGASKVNLEAKLKRIDDTQATALMIWATAFWVSKEVDAASLEEYVKTY
ncbi:MAG: hypothetical protein AB7E47_11495 [Desulfovibrionaceae bacterium]